MSSALSNLEVIEVENVGRRKPNVQSKSKNDAAGIQRRDELSAGSLGCGNDLVEALIAAQRIPAWVKAEIAV